MDIFSLMIIKKQTHFRRCHVHLWPPLPGSFATHIQQLLSPPPFVHPHLPTTTTCLSLSRPLSLTSWRATKIRNADHMHLCHDGALVVRSNKANLAWKECCLVLISYLFLGLPAQQYQITRGELFHHGTRPALTLPHCQEGLYKAGLV